jgi:hypothetical protein
VYYQLRQGGFIFGMGAVYLATGLKLLQSEVAWAIILLSKILERFNNLFIHALAEKELGGLMKSNNEYSSNT